MSTQSLNSLASPLSFEEQLRKLNLEQFNADLEAAEEISWLKNACELRDLFQRIEERAALELDLRTHEKTRKDFNESIARYNTEQSAQEKRIAALDAPTRATEQALLNKFIAELMRSPKIMMAIWNLLIKAPLIASVTQKLQTTTFTIHDTTYKASKEAIARIEEKLAALPLPVDFTPGSPISVPGDPAATTATARTVRYEELLKEQLAGCGLGAQATVEQQIVAAKQLSQEFHDVENIVQQEQDVVTSVLTDDFGKKSGLPTLEKSHIEGIRETVNLVLPKTQREQQMRECLHMMIEGCYRGGSPLRMLEFIKGLDPEMGHSMESNLVMLGQQLLDSSPTLKSLVQQSLTPSYATFFKSKPCAERPRTEPSMYHSSFGYGHSE